MAAGQIPSTQSRTFEQARESVPAARRYVVELLAHLPDDLASTAALLVSELAANAVLYGVGPFEVSVQRSQEGARVGVTDGGNGEPTPQHPSDTAEHGRGLQLVGALASDWGVQRDTANKTVWFELRA
ncbi:MAG: ATP-binding protein [Motilibacteraceae bacterium]